MLTNDSAFTNKYPGFDENSGYKSPYPDKIIDPLDVKHHLYALPGAGGNHIRWLCFLDKQFELPGLLTDHTSDPLPLIKSLTEKREFLFSVVYPYSRNLSNWIKIEALNRTIVNNIIYFDHWDTVPVQYVRDRTIKKLIVMADLDVCTTHFRKFKPNLDHFNTPENFKKSMQLNYNAFAVANNKIITDSMFQKTLPRDLYSQIISVFDLDDNYDTAKLIHKRWYELISKKTLIKG